MKSLDNVEINRKCKVVEIQSENIATRRRILDMGITPGVEITIIKTAPFGDPLEVKLRGYALSFRNVDAKSIIVEEV